MLQLLIKHLLVQQPVLQDLLLLFREGKPHVQVVKLRAVLHVQAAQEQPSSKTKTIATVTEMEVTTATSPVMMTLVA